MQRRYFISSRADPAERQLAVIRSHWGIENELHWCLDVAFGEDASRIRKGDGAQNFSFLRRLALTLLKRETNAKMGLKAKRHKAGWITTTCCVSWLLAKTRLPYKAPT